MHGQSNRLSKERAITLRKAMTDAENVLWFRLRRNLLNHRFRRQHPFGQYIVDFVCLERQLIVEVDGSQHADSKGDAIRTAFLERSGFRVLRFDNLQVLLELDAVLEVICRALEPIPSPTLPLKGRE